PVLLQVPPAGDAGLADGPITVVRQPPRHPHTSTTPDKEGAIVSKFRPPRRSGWRAPWVSGVLAVLIAAALAGAGAAAGAQEAAPDGGDTATTVADPSSDSTAPDDTTTDTTAAQDHGAYTTDTPAAHTADTTAAQADAAAPPDTPAADTTDTTAADAGDGEDAAADPNGNVNDLPLNSGVQTGTGFNDAPYGEIRGA